MKRIRLFLAAVAALAVTSGIALAPALTSATSASAQPSCTGTSLFGGLLNPPDQVRVPTLGNNTRNLNCELGLGNTGVAVQRLQIALDSRCNLFDNLAVDGIYGPLTRQAVIDVQNFYDVAGRWDLRAGDRHSSELASRRQQRQLLRLPRLSTLRLPGQGAGAGAGPGT